MGTGILQAWWGRSGPPGPLAQGSSTLQPPERREGGGGAGLSFLITRLLVVDGWVDSRLESRGPQL